MPNSRPGKPASRPALKAASAALGLAAGLLLIELGLRAAGVAVRAWAGPPPPPPGPGPTVLCAGDSFTWGMGAKTGYPEQLGARLGVRVVNAGVPGLPTDELLVRLEDQLRRWRPAVVVVVTGANDGADLLRLQRSRVGRALRLVKLWRLLRARPAAPPRGAVDTPDAALAELATLYWDRRFDLAFRRWEDHAARFPDSEAVGAWKLRALIRAGFWHEAARHGAQVTREHPGWVEAARPHVRNLMTLRRFAQAREALRAARARFPDDAELAGMAVEIDAFRPAPPPRPLDARGSAPDGEGQDLAARTARHHVRALLDLTRRFDARLILASYPGQHLPGMRAAAREAGVPYVDVAAAFRLRYGTAQGWSTPDGHTDDAGYGVMAAAIAPAVRDALNARSR